MRPSKGYSPGDFDLSGELKQNNINFDPQMKTFRFLSLLLLSYLCSPVMGQDTITVEAYCNFDGMEPVSGKYVIQDASEESLEIVSAILAVNDIEANFILRESPCRNALATRVGKRRFILYNPEFIKKFSIDAQSKWAVWLVLLMRLRITFTMTIFRKPTPSYCGNLNKKRTSSPVKPFTRWAQVWIRCYPASGGIRNTALRLLILRRESG